jgi:hypothetical protein
MEKYMKKSATAYLVGAAGVALVSVLLLLSAHAFAAVLTVGNDSAVRTQVDTASNFTVIDTNHSATANGQITSFGYYASNMNPFSFVVVDSANKVKYVSPLVTPSALGVNTYTPTSPVSVSTGDNLGVYFSMTGTIPFEFTGALASYTSFGVGSPTIGSTLSFLGNGNRTYSIVANGTTGTIEGGGNGNGDENNGGKETEDSKDAMSGEHNDSGSGNDNPGSIGSGGDNSSSSPSDSSGSGDHGSSGSSSGDNHQTPPPPPPPPTHSDNHSSNNDRGSSDQHQSSSKSDK